MRRSADGDRRTGEDIRSHPREVRGRRLRDGRSVHGTDQRPGIACESCERRLAAAGRALSLRSKRIMRRSSSTRSPVREQVLKKVQLEQSIGFVHMYDGRFRDAAHVAREGSRDGPIALVPAKTRSRLMAVLGIVAMRRGEIENCLECAGPSSCIFPIAKRGPASKPAGLARGHQVVHGVSRGISAGPANHLALEHRLHDAGRASRESAAAIPDPDRGVSLECRGYTVRECRASSRDGCARPESGRREYLRRFQRRQPAGPVHDVA